MQTLRSSILGRAPWMAATHTKKHCSRVVLQAMLVPERRVVVKGTKNVRMREETARLLDQTSDFIMREKSELRTEKQFYSPRLRWGGRCIFVLFLLFFFFKVYFIEE